MNSKPVSVPTIVLVRPEIPENLGFIARTLDCFGTQGWRIVGSEHISLAAGSAAFKTVSGAEKVLEACQRHATLSDAIADCHEVWGFSRRSHGPRPLENLSDALADLHPNSNLAWVFGPESQGLNQGDAPWIQRWIRIETAHPTMSLNLSHAVAISLYAWNHVRNSGRIMGSVAAMESTLHADRALMERGWNIVESAVMGQAIFPPNKAEAQINHLRQLWNRIQLSSEEAQFLIGTLKVLFQGRKPRRQDPL